mgnify:FL=1
MKFKPGNIVTHVPTKSKWIILSKEEYKPELNQPVGYLFQVKAVCILVGKKPQYWNINQQDDFLLTRQDLEPTDFVWRVDYAA